MIDHREGYHLTLAELVNNDKTYASFYDDEGTHPGFVILDNGAYEFGKTPSITDLVSAAYQINPTEVVLPDSMHGPHCAEETVEMSFEGAGVLWSSGFTRYMAVPHGNNWSEWIGCASRLATIQGVRCFGIAEKDAIKINHGDRVGMARKLKSSWPHIDVHYLGMMEDMADVKDPWSRANVRGVDGSKLVVWGMNLTRVWSDAISPIQPYPGRPEGYFDFDIADADEGVMRTIGGNIHDWRRFAWSD